MIFTGWHRFIERHTMREADLRKWHRTGGVFLAFFIFLHIITGIVLSVEDLLGEYWGGIHDIHGGFGKIGGIYRILLGIGLVWIVISGCIIYMNIRKRMKKRI